MGRQEVVNRNNPDWPTAAIRLVPTRETVRPALGFGDGPALDPVGVNSRLRERWKARKVRQHRGLPQSRGWRDIALGQREIQAEVNRTREQWLALHHAFPSYCEVKPWERLTNEVVVVNDPLGRFEGYCVTLGDGGVAYGPGVYLRDRGHINYLTTVTAEDEPDGAKALERGLAVSNGAGRR